MLYLFFLWSCCCCGEMMKNKFIQIQTTFFLLLKDKLRFHVLSSFQTQNKIHTKRKLSKTKIVIKWWWCNERKTTLIMPAFCPCRKNSTCQKTGLCLGVYFNITNSFQDVKDPLNYLCHFFLRFFLTCLFFWWKGRREGKAILFLEIIKENLLKIYNFFRIGWKAYSTKYLVFKRRFLSLKTWRMRRYSKESKINETYVAKIINWAASE